MERIDFKKLFFITLIFSLCAGSLHTPVYADDVMTLSTLVTPQNVDFNICTKTYSMPADKLFYLSIASANANRFKIEEIQSKTGYILFTAVNKQYLASVAKVDASHSMLKITPTNNNYFFAPGIVLNFFKYIDINGASPVTTVPKV